MEQSLGEKIRKVRGKRTAAEFVEGFEICPNTLFNYEAGRRVPDAGFLKLLCEREGVDPAWLLGIAPPGEG